MYSVWIAQKVLLVALGLKIIKFFFCVLQCMVDILLEKLFISSIALKLFKKINIKIFFRKKNYLTK